VTTTAEQAAVYAQRIMDLEAEVERLRSALEEIRRLTKSASDVFIIQLGSVAAQALHPDWRDGGAAPRGGEK